MRQPAGGDDHHVRRIGQNDLGIRERVEPEGHAHAGAFLKPPLNDLDHLGAAFGLGGQTDLASRIVRSFVYDHLVTAFGGNAGGLKPCRSRAHDHHPAFGGGAGGHMRLFQLAPRGRVVQAKRHPALIDAIKAIVCPHARADAVFFAAHNLGNDMRVGHVGAGHAHHVELAAGNGVAGGRHILNLGGVERREIRCSLDFPGEIQMRGRPHPLHRDQVGQASVGVDMTFDHVQEIHHTAVFQTARDFQPIILGQTAGQLFIASIAHTDDKIGANPVANGFQRVKGKPQPVFKAAAVGAIQIVGQRRPELVHQVAVGLQFDPVETCVPHPFSGVSVIFDDAGNIPVFDLFRKGLV